MSRTIVSEDVAKENAAQSRTETGGPPIQSKREISAGEILGMNHAVTARAKGMSDADEKPVKRFRITKAGSFTQGGVKHALYEGKVIDERNYDLKALRSQGVKMQELTKDDEDY